MDRLLVIEDEELIRESIADYLQQEGYECSTAHNGLEGIKIAKSEIPDLIICDIKMPGLNGHQVLQELRSHISTSTIPFIFLSAMVDKEDLRTGMALGADDYITKPFQPEDLLNSVKTRLEKYSVLKKRMDVLKDSIATALPHELQTPLVAVMGYAEMLTDKFSDNSDPEALEFSEGILQAGLRLNRLIKNFIFYEKLELMHDGSKPLGTDQATVPITSDLINSLSEKVIERYNRRSDLEISSEDAAIYIPITYFTILIEELLDNAFKFSDPGSKVTLTCSKQNNNYVLKVTDLGRGMTEEQIESIGAYLQFERDKYEQQGMGLGLTLSRKIIELYGGEFKINSKYGEHTEVIATCPLAE